MADGIPERAIDPKAVSTAAAKMPTAREERHMARVLEGLCDATRVKIVRALSEDNTLAAGDLAQVIGRSRSATSQHLKVLREIGAVVSRREGNVVRYSLAADVTAQVLERATAALDGLKGDAAASAAE
jgi:DNA-binding transcriptional ArsR family regulator